MHIPGVEYVVDTGGKRKAVLIDLRRHAALWEDMLDSYLAQQRGHEPRSSLEEVRAALARRKHKPARPAAGHRASG